MFSLPPPVSLEQEQQLLFIFRIEVRLHHQPSSLAAPPLSLPASLQTSLDLSAA